MPPDTAETEFVGEHEIRIGELPTPVRVRMLRRRSDGALLIQQSHFIKTAIQYLPYTASQAFFCSEQEALETIQKTMMNFYDSAVKRGYDPSGSWLVANSIF